MRSILLAAAAAVALLANAAQAQTPGAAASPFADGPAARSLIPARSRLYVGLNLGRSRYSAPCGATSLNCDSTDNSVRISAGSMPGDFWGVELAYLDMGRIARAGGNSAQGLSMSLVGKTPVWQSLGVFGKVGATYARTDASSTLASGLAGPERSFGLSFGAGVSYDFTPRLSATLAWDSHDFRFGGVSRDPVRSTSLGLQYRY